MEVRWAPGSVDRMRAFAKELVDLKPDMILANSTPATAAFQLKSDLTSAPRLPQAVHDGIISLSARKRHLKALTDPNSCFA